TADEKTLIFTRLIQSRGRKHEDFYVAKKQGNEWSKAYNLGVPVNTPKNQGAHTITPDGRYLIFTGGQYRDSRGSCDLYITSRRQGRYSEPQNLGRPVNTGAWESQPSIAPDASTLYFASNRNEGSYGGSDIWKTNYLGDGEWSEPENLGPRVNTPKDERAPFIHSGPSRATSAIPSTRLPTIIGCLCQQMGRRLIFHRTGRIPMAIWISTPSICTRRLNRGRSPM
ncbi:MAG: hypothetical protein BRD50_05060, partial [Bacteroidetes bacterium SW_11_45_7]